MGRRRKKKWSRPKAAKVCPHCGRTFQPRNNIQRQCTYCRVESKRTHKKRICTDCNRPFTPRGATTKRCDACREYRYRTRVSYRATHLLGKTVERLDGRLVEYSLCKLHWADALMGNITTDRGKVTCARCLRYPQQQE